MTKKMVQNREKMRAKLNVFYFILVLYSQPLNFWFARAQECYSLELPAGGMVGDF
jgi:hypothetical protein